MGALTRLVEHPHAVIRQPLPQIPKIVRWISGSNLSLEIGPCFGREGSVTFGNPRIFDLLLLLAVLVAQNSFFCKG